VSVGTRKHSALLVELHHRGLVVAGCIDASGHLGEHLACEAKADARGHIEQLEYHEQHLIR